jgi:hypothetical protein
VCECSEIAGSPQYNEINYKPASVNTSHFPKIKIISKDMVVVASELQRRIKDKKREFEMFSMFTVISNVPT